MVAFFVPPPLGAVPLTAVAFVTSATSDTQTITCPSVSQYDIGVLFDVASDATTPANIIPSGFTQLQTSTINIARTTLSYKILAGTEGGASLTGMNSTDTAKVLLIFRPNSGILGVGVSAFLQETINGDPASQLIAASGQVAPLIRLASAAVANPTPSSPPTFTAGTFDGTVPRAGANGVAIRAGYTVQNSSPSNDTVDVGDNGAANCLISGWMNFT